MFDQVTSKIANGINSGHGVHAQELVAMEKNGAKELNR